jgi:glucose-6-phosphate dehydrogenase assembly protein OpcA
VTRGRTTRPTTVLSQVEADLRALWATPPKPGETPTSRACTMNLVVVAATAAQGEQWAPIVDQVIQAVPARAIVVGLEPDGEDGLEAETSAVCAPAVGGGPLVCSERVTLRAGGGVCARLSSCIAALCSTDVPTTVVWLGRAHDGRSPASPEPGQNLMTDRAFAPLAHEADRIVLDTAEGSLASLAHVVSWARTRAAADRADRIGVADLAWTRLAPWQEMTARLFDDPRLRPLATNVSRVGILQASRPGMTLGTEGALLLGWLATRLGWKAGSIAGKLRLVRPDDATVQSSLRADASCAASPGSLVAVTVEAALGPLSMRGSISRQASDADAAIWSLEVTSGGEAQRIEQRVRLRSADAAPLLERTLHRPVRDEALAEAALWANELLEEELACT